MKTVISTLALAVCLLLSAVAAAPQDEQALVKKLQMVNVDQVLQNDRLLKSALKCILSDTDAGCTAEVKEVKNVIPYLVATGCGPCTDTQKDDGAKVLKVVIERHPEEWRQVMAKFDPDGKYAKQHGDFWRSKGVKI